MVLINDGWAAADYRFYVAIRFLHPEGLPSDYTLTILFRLLSDTPQEPFALWEILNNDSEPLVGVILDSMYIIVQSCSRGHNLEEHTANSCPVSSS